MKRRAKRADPRDNARRLIEVLQNRLAEIQGPEPELRARLEAMLARLRERQEA